MILALLKAYYDHKGDVFIELGVQLLALNKFLAGYIDSDEPFPPTKAFIKTVKDNITPLIFPDNVKPEQIIKQFEGIGLDIVSSFSRKKETKIATLIQTAQIAFMCANFFTRTLTCLFHFPKEAPKTFEEASSLYEHIQTWIDFMRLSDEVMQMAHFEIGYWTRRVEDLRKRKMDAQNLNKTKTRRIRGKKQWVLETYYKIEDRSELSKHPYKLANKIAERWAPKDPKDKAPHQVTIVRWLKDEKIIK